MAMPIAFRGPGRLYLTFAAGTEQEVTCELMGAKLTVNADNLEVVTGCGAAVSVGPARYTLDLQYVQDVSSTSTLMMCAFVHHSQYVDFLFVPDNKLKSEITAAHPGFTGKAVVVASDIGATATEIAQTAASWPVSGTPVIVTTPPAALMSEEAEEEETVLV